MKKLLIIFMVAVIVSFTACANAANDGEKKNDIGVEAEATAENPQSASIGSVAEGSGTVDLTLPAVIFGMATGEENLSPGIDLTDYLRRNNFTGARWNADHSLTVTMTKERYTQYKADMSGAVEETLDGLLTYPYVDMIEKAPDYKTVTIMVDCAIFEEDGIDSADDLMSYYQIPMVGSYINVYRMFVGLDNEYSITIEDSVSGRRLGRIVYPL